MDESSDGRNYYDNVRLADVPVLALREGCRHNLVDQAVSAPLPEGWSEFNVVELSTLVSTVLHLKSEIALDFC
jgi:hypothetical protein